MNSEINKKYQRLISEVDNLAHPRILINICSHGNEVLGLEVVNKLKNIQVISGSITFHTANELAIKQKRRFIDSDLNRSFPGSVSGNYEQQIASEMMKYIPYFDYVIDIHSTVSDTKDCLIIEDNSSEIQKLISVCQNAKTVLLMTATKGTSIFRAMRLPKKIIPAIVFEYGDNNISTTEKTFSDILNILYLLRIIESMNPVVKTHKLQQFECYSTYPKSETDITNPKIKNYEMVHKGDIIGYSKNGTSILSDSDFYPILFGEINYTTIFGFKANKLE